MIGSLEGKVQKLKPFEAVISCSGVGYVALITLQAFEYLNKLEPENDAFLHIRTISKDTGVTLYGFSNESELALFDFLISLQGIGPKNALNLISHLGEKELLTALTEENSGLIIKTPGVGQSKAKKILFEAQQKKKKLKEIMLSIDQPSQGAARESINVVLETVYEALQNLGFQIKEIEKAKTRIDFTTDSGETEKPPLDYNHMQDWIRLYLKYL
ncbi:MAG: Holliday junction branch migration protein RuvA [Leptospirales bacterium]